MNVKVVGIDLAKNVFQVCVLLNDGNIAWNRKITRTKLLHTLRRFPAKPLIAMETCSTSHHCARQFITMGHNMHLITAQHVKPFVGRQKMMLMTLVLFVKRLFGLASIPFQLRVSSNKILKLLGA
ncbi:hypothetical protein BA953_24885 (plasmid) [Vibrio coralliilyticus]|nr:hypothetical protein BA953_24885 [Vibrio coralliilyticus]